MTISSPSSDGFGCLEKHLQTIHAIPEITASALTHYVGISHINQLGAFIIPLGRPEITLRFRRACAWTCCKEHGGGRAVNYTDHCGSTRRDHGITECLESGTDLSDHPVPTPFLLQAGTPPTRPGCSRPYTPPWAGALTTSLFQRPHHPHSKKFPSTISSRFPLL